MRLLGLLLTGCVTPLGKELKLSGTQASPLKDEGAVTPRTQGCCHFSHLRYIYKLLLTVPAAGKHLTDVGCPYCYYML